MRPSRRLLHAWVALFCACSACGSTSEERASTPACDQTCVDDLSIRAVRQTLKLVYNLALQGGSVGDQDVTSPCPIGGSVHVTGTATSDSLQGTTTLDLSYDFSTCAVVAAGTSAYELTMDGTVLEKGVLPSSGSNTALLIDAEALHLQGTVSTPPLPVEETCVMALSQNGDDVTGEICERTASFSY